MRVRQLAVVLVGLTVMCLAPLMVAYGYVRSQLPEIHLEPTSVADVPPHVVHAFLAAEDARFYDHRGADLLAVGRAVFNNAKPGTQLQGGSTITQQTAKLLLWRGGRERNLTRKMKETVLAIELERRYSKQEILADYLERVYLGAGVWGLREAAQHYFDKPVEALTLAEGAVLAGIPAHPAVYGPYANSGGAQSRRAYVLERMLVQGWATPEEVAAACAADLPTEPQR